MIRPQFESLVRGAWALHCADAATMHAIADGKRFVPMLGTTAPALTAANPPFTVAGAPVPFDVLDSRTRVAMNDHTHRGAHALARRMQALTHDSGAMEDDELALFHLGSSMGGLAAAALLERAGRAESVRAVLERLAETTLFWEPSVPRLSSSEPLPGPSQDV